MKIIPPQLLSMIAMTVFFVVSAQANEFSTEDAGTAIPAQDCVMEPSEIVDVGSAIPGVVEAIHAYRSDLVKKGTVIVELESSVEKATLDLAKVRAGLDTAIELRQESARFGSLTQQRNEKLLRKSAISLQDMDKLKTETSIAKLQVRQEQDNKSIAELEYNRAQAILQQRTILSPVEGVVMERFKSVGEFVEDEPLLRIAKLHPLHVEVIVPVDYLGRIVPGMQAEVTTGLVGSGIYRATVERVDRVADAASGTYGVRLSLPNPDYKIPAGLRCQLNFLPSVSTEPEQTANNIDDDSANEQGPEGPIDEQSAARSTPELPASAVTLEATVEESTEQLNACYSVGPVANEDLAMQLSARFEESIAALMLRSESAELDKGYSVLAAPTLNTEGSRQLLARLGSAGISDRFLLTRGKYKGRVSLGYFRALKSAVKQQELLALKGFEAELVPHRASTRHYWLDISLKAGSDLTGQLKEIAESLAPTVSFKPLACFS